MRTTLTLDDDVAAKLKAQARRSGRAFRDVVNDMLRRGLTSVKETQPSNKFKVTPCDFGAMAPGLSLDSVAKLIDQVEGPQAR
jgi:plasmid stability protein